MGLLKDLWPPPEGPDPLTDVMWMLTWGAIGGGFLGVLLGVGMLIGWIPIGS